MKKEKLAQFFKSKGFYVSMFAGICAVFVIAMVYLNILSINKKSEKNLADLNEPINQMAEGDKQQGNNTNLKQNLAQNEETGKTKPEQKENQSESKTEPNTTNTKNTEEEKNKKSEEKEKTDGAELESSYGEPEVNKTQEVSSVNMEQNVLQSLNFNEENGLLWPVEGNIIKNYSADHLIYFDTLAQFRCNPAIMIDAEVGTDVYCAAKGVIKDISTQEETGLTITMEIGNDYEVIYGQLEDVQFKTGDVVEEGTLLGKVAQPTKYFTVEGSNLYLKVLEKGESVNPLLLLR